MTDESLPVLTKDLFQVGAWFVAILAGTIAAYRATTEMRRARVQRELELKWNQAKLAKETLSEFEDEPEYQRACQMIDWRSCEFDVGDGRTISVNSVFVIQSLRVVQLKFSKEERFVRESFIAFFNGLEWIEHFIRRDLINFEDLRPILEYRVKTMARTKDVYTRFLVKYEYDLALGFLERFDGWNLVK